MPSVNIKVYRDSEGRIIPVNIRREFSKNVHRRRSIEKGSTDTNADRPSAETKENNGGSGGGDQELGLSKSNAMEIEENGHNENAGSEGGENKEKVIVEGGGNNNNDDDDDDEEGDDYKEGEDGEDDDDEEEEEGEDDEEGGEYDDYEEDSFESLFGPSSNAGGGGSSAWVAQACSKIMKNLSFPEMVKSRDPTNVYDLSDDLIDDSESAYANDSKPSTKRKASTSSENPPKKKSKVGKGEDSEKKKKKKEKGSHDKKHKDKKGKKEETHEKKEKKEKKEETHEKKEKKEKKEGTHEKKEKKEEDDDVIFLGEIKGPVKKEETGDKADAKKKSPFSVKRSTTSLLSPPKEEGAGDDSRSATMQIKEQAAKKSPEKKGAEPGEAGAASTAGSKTSESSLFISQEIPHLDSSVSAGKNEKKKEKHVITEEDILHYKVPEEFPAEIKAAINSFHGRYIKDRNIKANDFLVELGEIVQKGDYKGIVGKVSKSLSEIINLQPPTIRKKILGQTKEKHAAHPEGANEQTPAQDDQFIARVVKKVEANQKKQAGSIARKTQLPPPPKQQATLTLEKVQSPPRKNLETLPGKTQLPTPPKQQTTLTLEKVQSPPRKNLEVLSGKSQSSPIQQKAAGGNLVKALSSPVQSQPQPQQQKHFFLSPEKTLASPPKQRHMIQRLPLPPTASQQQNNLYTQGISLQLPQHLQQKRMVQGIIGSQYAQIVHPRIPNPTVAKGPIPSSNVFAMFSQPQTQYHQQIQSQYQSQLQQLQKKIQQEQQEENARDQTPYITEISLNPPDTQNSHK